MKAQSRSCPICKHPVLEGQGAERYRPFCSKRCADVDLSRWLAGVYAIPATPSEEASENEIAEGLSEAESQSTSEPQARH
jgi:uncharacterized protein